MKTRKENQQFQVGYLKLYDKKDFFTFGRDRGKKQDKNSNFQLFLVRLALLALVDWLRFCLMVWTLCLIVGLAIGKAISIRENIAITFLR